MLKRIYHSDWLLLALFLLAAGGASVFFRFEVSCDWANYHFYNPWAFLNNRWGYDVLPAGINTFLNPLADIPLYLMIKYWNNHPDLIIFIQGFWSGAVAFAFFKIIGLFFDSSSWKGRAQIALALLIGITSWPFFMQLGTSTNEMMTSLLVLIGYYLVLRELKSGQELRGNIFFISGLLLGAAAGLKLTAITYCISGGAALILCWRNFRPFPKLLGCFILGGLVGFLLTNGFWMYRLWESYDNPFFPLFNGIFQSEYFDLSSFRDGTYLPKTIWGYLFYPFYVAAFKMRAEGSMLIIDYRNVLLYLLAVGYIGYVIYHRGQQQKPSSLSAFLWSLCLCSYLAWLLLFCIFRYYMPVSLLGSIILVQAAFFLYPKCGDIKQIIYASLMVILGYALLSTPHYSDVWGKRLRNFSEGVLFYARVWPEFEKDITRFEKYGEFTKFVDMEDIRLPDNTLLQMYNMPVAGALPLLNQHSNVRGVLMFTDGYNQEGAIFDSDRWLEMKKKIVSEHQGPKAILIGENQNVSRNNIFHEYAKSQGLECRLIVNNLFDWVLCVPKEQIKSIFRGRN